MEKDFVFSPWNDYEKKVEEGCLDIDISEPPCKHCKFWRPRITTDSYGDLSGINLCRNKEMFHDFSCFEKIGEIK